MFEKKKLLTAALGLIGLGTTALDSHAGICFSVTPPPPWNNLYACGANGTIDTRDSCSPAFPGGQPICVPRLAVQKNGGLITKAEGINSAGNPIAGCSALDSVADGKPVVRGAECSTARAVKFEVTF